MRVASLALPIALLPACRVSAGVGDLVDTVKTTPHASVGGMQRITLPECSDPAPAATGHVVFRLPDGHVYRLAADGSSSPEDISKKLDRIEQGAGRHTEHEREEVPLRPQYRGFDGRRRTGWWLRRPIVGLHWNDGDFLDLAVFGLGGGGLIFLPGWRVTGIRGHAARID